MASKIQKVTLFPALFLFFLSIVFSVITLIVGDFSLRQLLLILTCARATMSLFIAGLVLAVYWGYSWVFSKKFHERETGFFVWLLAHSRLIGFGCCYLSLGGRVGLERHCSLGKGVEFNILCFKSR